MNLTESLSKHNLWLNSLREEYKERHSTNELSTGSSSSEDNNSSDLDLSTTDFSLEVSNSPTTHLSQEWLKDNPPIVCRENRQNGFNK